MSFRIMRPFLNDKLWKVKVELPQALRPGSDSVYAHLGFGASSIVFYLSVAVKIYQDTKLKTETSFCLCSESH